MACERGRCGHTILFKELEGGGAVVLKLRHGCREERVWVEGNLWRARDGLNLTESCTSVEHEQGLEYTGVCHGGLLSCVRETTMGGGCRRC